MDINNIELIRNIDLLTNVRNIPVDVRKGIDVLLIAYRQSNQENARLREGLEDIESLINADVYDDRLDYIKELATEALKKGEYE